MKTMEGEIRAYRDQDEAAVLDCLEASLGGGPAGRRPPEYFRWKHYLSPFGRSFMMVAESHERIAGLRAFMRWQFRTADREFLAVRAVDTATHPDFQGQGIFTKLTLGALDALRAEGADFVFNTPNDNSLPGYLKMGWKIIGRVPISVRVRRPVRFVLHLRSGERAVEAKPSLDAPTAFEALSGDAVDELLAESAVYDARFRTPRNAAYLRWRYGGAPLLDYRGLREEAGGRLRGLALFRLRPEGGLWGTSISELIVRPGDSATARRLIGRVRGASRVDYLACHFPAGSTAASAARRAAYLRAPRGLLFVTNPLAKSITPDPTSLGSWALSIGDLEVF